MGRGLIAMVACPGSERKRAPSIDAAQQYHHYLGDPGEILTPHSNGRSAVTVVGSV